MSPCCCPLTIPAASRVEGTPQSPVNSNPLSSSPPRCNSRPGAHLPVQPPRLIHAEVAGAPHALDGHGAHRHGADLQQTCGEREPAVSSAPPPARPPVPFPRPSRPFPQIPALTLRALATDSVHPAVAADAQEAAEEPVLAGGVEVPQPDGFPPAVVDVWARVGQRQGPGGSGGSDPQQRQGSAGGGGARPHPRRPQTRTRLGLGSGGGVAAGGAGRCGTGLGALCGRRCRGKDVARAEPAPRLFIGLRYQPDRFGRIQLQYRARFIAGIGRVGHSPRKY